MINPANRVKSIELSQIRKMFEVNNPNAINLGIGEPDFDTPEHIKDSVVDALNKGFTGYTPNKGIPELREAISDKLKKDNNIDVNSDSIIVTVGGSEALYMCTQALINLGDEVIVPNPGFLSYAACVNLAEGVSVSADLKLEDSFRMTLEDVEEKLTNKTKCIILNSPSNPTGSVMHKKDIKGICKLADDEDILIISDEIYEKIIYDVKHYSPAQFSDNVILINGFSKAYSMTGFRIAYVSAREDILEELLKVHQYNTACASSISQYAALTALKGPQDCVKDMVSEFKNRRDLITTRLNDMGWECPHADGAFYIFPKVGDGDDFVKEAMKNDVICVPGKAFGSNGEEFVRFSYADSYENIDTAMNRLENVKL